MNQYFKPINAIEMYHFLYSFVILPSSTSLYDNNCIWVFVSNSSSIFISLITLLPTIPLLIFHTRIYIRFWCAGSITTTTIWYRSWCYRWCGLHQSSLVQGRESCFCNRPLDHLAFFFITIYLLFIVFFLFHPRPTSLITQIPN